MIDWAINAETIVNQLRATVLDLATVLHIKDAETESNPATLPAAYVIMAKTAFAPAGPDRSDVVITWQVLIRCKQMVGSTGALVMAKAIVESLSGFQVDQDQGMLRPVAIEFFREEMRPEPAYVLTFTTMADQVQPENSTY